MTGRRRFGLGAAALAVCVFVAVAPGGDANERKGPVPAAKGPAMRIGMMGTLFRDLPEQLVLVLMKPFGTLMEAQTGVSGDLVPVKTAEELGQQLADDKLQLGVFHGVEFAWARQKHPNLQPLLIAVNEQAHLRAAVLVRSDSPATELAQLKGQTLAWPAGTREHCRLFLESRCEKAGQAPEQLFGKVLKPGNVEDAIDDVVDNVAQAVIVDSVALDRYKRRKPARFNRLKVVAESETFPAAVLAYRPGSIDPATAKKFRDGMLTCKQTAMGRQLMTLWKLTSFEPVPADYEQILADIVKAYPPPTAKPPTEGKPVVGPR